MSSSFSKELIGRSVVDSHGEYLGRLNDIVFDVSSGVVTDLHVEVEANIDVSKLPWESQGNIVQIPIDVIKTVATQIHLNINKNRRRDGFQRYSNFYDPILQSEPHSNSPSQLGHSNKPEASAGNSISASQ